MLLLYPILFDNLFLEKVILFIYFIHIKKLKIKNYLLFQIKYSMNKKNYFKVLKYKLYYNGM